MNTKRELSLGAVFVLVVAMEGMSARSHRILHRPTHIAAQTHSPRSGAVAELPQRERGSVPTVRVDESPLFVALPAVVVPRLSYVLDGSGFSGQGRWAVMATSERDLHVIVATTDGTARAIRGTWFYKQVGIAAPSVALHGHSEATQHAPSVALFDRDERYLVGAGDGVLRVFDLEEGTVASLGSAPEEAPRNNANGDRLAWRCDTAAHEAFLCVYEYSLRALRRIPLPQGTPTTLHWTYSSVSRIERFLTEILFTRSQDRSADSSYASTQGRDSGEAMLPRGDALPDAVLVDVEQGSIERYSVEGADITFLERSPDRRFVAARLSPSGLAIFRRGERTPLLRRARDVGQWQWETEGNALAWVDASGRESLHIEWIAEGREQRIPVLRSCADGALQINVFTGAEVLGRVDCGNSDYCARGSVARYQRYNARTGTAHHEPPLEERDAYCENERTLPARARRMARQANHGAEVPSIVRFAFNEAHAVVQTSEGLTSVGRAEDAGAMGVFGVLEGSQNGFSWELLPAHGDRGWLGVNAQGEASVWAGRSTSRRWNSTTEQP